MRKALTLAQVAGCCRSVKRPAIISGSKRDVKGAQVCIWRQGCNICLVGMADDHTERMQQQDECVAAIRGKYGEDRVYISPAGHIYIG